MSVTTACRDCRYYMPPDNNPNAIGGFCLAFVYDDDKAALIDQDITHSQAARFQVPCRMSA